MRDCGPREITARYLLLGSGIAVLCFAIVLAWQFVVNSAGSGPLLAAYYGVCATMAASVVFAYWPNRREPVLFASLIVHGLMSAFMLAMCLRMVV